MACQSLPGIELVPPAGEARSLNHWTTREAPLKTLHLPLQSINRQENILLYFYLSVDKGLAEISPLPLSSSRACLQFSL